MPSLDCHRVLRGGNALDPHLLRLASSPTIPLCGVAKQHDRPGPEGAPRLGELPEALGRRRSVKPVEVCGRGEHAGLALGQHVGVPAGADQDQHRVEGTDPGKLRSSASAASGSSARKRSGSRRPASAASATACSRSTLSSGKPFIGSRSSSARGVGKAARRSPSSSNSRPSRVAICVRVAAAWRAGRRRR
jgi:hypothetical protein